MFTLLLILIKVKESSKGFSSIRKDLHTQEEILTNKNKCTQMKVSECGKKIVAKCDEKVDQKTCEKIGDKFGNKFGGKIGKRWYKLLTTW